MNEGVVELGFENVSVLWCGKYDMLVDEFFKELDCLWM